MDMLTIAVSILLGVAFLGAGMAKLRRQEPVTGTLEALGVGASLQRTIGALEILGGAGVALGLLVQPLGVAAATGLLVLMVGAVAFHAQAHDTFKSSLGAVVLLVVAGAVTTLQFASL